MKVSRDIRNDKRIRILVGHYGSGKTEFAINYAIKLVGLGEKTALVDLDIANPYFRSRERQSLIEEKGIVLYSNTYGYDITADLPALTSGIRAPLEDRLCQVVIDVGGDSSGARILTQYKKYFTKDSYDMIFILNANRPETSTPDKAINYIRAIEDETSLKVSAIVNNTHMLGETQIGDIIKGYELGMEIEKKIKIPLTYNCIRKNLKEEFSGSLEKIDNFNIFDMTIFMRESWMNL